MDINLGFKLLIEHVKYKTKKNKKQNIQPKIKQKYTNVSLKF